MRFSIYLPVIFPLRSYRPMYRKLKKVVLSLLADVTPSFFFFGRFIRSEALVCNSYIFSEQPFFGNHSTLDSVDYEQSLFFVGPSSKTPKTRK